jgi:hypothetical protein
LVCTQGKFDVKSTLVLCSMTARLYVFSSVDSATAESATRLNATSAAPVFREADAICRYEAETIKQGFAAVAQSRLYLKLAICRSRIVRAIARAFFRVCGAVPLLRRSIFEDGSSAMAG